MARLYAGILGLLAFLTILVRGMLHGGSPESVLWSAWCSLVVFMLIGGVLGWMAGWIVEDTIRNQFALAMTARRKAMVLPLGSRSKVGE